MRVSGRTRKDRQRAGKQSAQGCQQHPVLGAKARPAVLSVEDLELVTEDDDLDILVVDSRHCAGEQSELRGQTR
jgi:hypothetical protein